MHLAPCSAAPVPAAHHYLHHPGMTTPEPSSPRPGNPLPAPGSGPCDDAGITLSSGGLEEELWLYGTDSPSPNNDDEPGSTPGHSKSCDGLQDVSSGSMEHKDDPLQTTQSSSDDSDTDSDDVRVTIGDIRTGALSCMGLAANQNVKGARSYGTSGKLPTKGIDFSAPGCINGLPVLEVDLDSFEEKPWRKPGADLSDYFNYGFNEATWKVYCEKQRRLQLGLENSHPHSKENKITVQQGRTGHIGKGEEYMFINSDLNFKIEEGKLTIDSSQNGKQAKSIDVIGGEICSISRVEGRRWDIQDSDDIPIQAVNNQEYKPHPLMQPPPPLLPPPSIVHNPPPFNGLPPPPLFFQRPPPPSTQVPPALHPAMLPPPLVPPPTVHIPPPSGPPVTYNCRPPTRQLYFSNGPSGMNYPVVSTAQTSWVTTVDKSTSSPGRNEWIPRKRQECEMDNMRNQNFNNYKSENERLLNYNHVRTYDYDCKYRRSWEKEKNHGEHRHRDREESTKHKSSRRKQDSEERESYRRHKRKKSKRSKDKSVDKEPTQRGSRHDLREKTTSISSLGSV